MNNAHQALLGRLREIIDETPRSGALNAGGKPLHIHRFAEAIEARADDGPALVDYVRSKVHAKTTASYDALIRAGRPDLTPEALAADGDAPWAGEFSDEDRQAAAERVSSRLAAHADATAAAEAKAVEHDRKIVDSVSQRRIERGNPKLTPKQEEEMLAERAARRANGVQGTL